MGIYIPGAEDRTIVMGQTGSGKTIVGAWLLSLQRLDRRPWIALDFKEEEFWDRVGEPYIQTLRLGQMPKKKGLFRLPVLPGQEEQLDEWLWKIWERGECGLFCDEVTRIKNSKAFEAILLQGRSRRIPVIACTQRPVRVYRELFSESRIKVVMNLDDNRDYETVEEFTRGAPIREDLPPHWFNWYDSKSRKLTILRPVPHPDTIAAEIRRKVPYSLLLA